MGLIQERRDERANHRLGPVIKDAPGKCRVSHELLLKVDQIETTVVVRVKLISNVENYFVHVRFLRMDEGLHQTLYHLIDLFIMREQLVKLEPRHTCSIET